MTCKVPTLVVTRKLISIFLHCFWQSHTKLFLCMYARVTLSSHVGDIIHFKVLFTVIMSMTRHFKTTTRRSNDKIYVCEVLHDKLFMMTSLLTGSIPRGYGPVKTPVTFGSKVRKRFPRISSSLLGTNKTSSVCVSNLCHYETNPQTSSYLYMYKHI